MALLQAFVPHKRFISALVWRHLKFSLPLEMNFSLGMRKYQVLITRDRRVFSNYHCGLGWYMVLMEGMVVEKRFTHELSSIEKGKVRAYSASLKKLLWLSIAPVLVILQHILKSLQ